VTTERWARIKAMFDQALDRPAAERRAWVAQQCAGDYDLGTQIAALLDAHDEDPSFLETAPQLDADDLAAIAGAAAAGSPATVLHPGAILGAGQYRIIGEIGRGGMGIVYLAQDMRLPRRVALKSLPEAARRDPERLERLRREAWAAAKISHPAVATIHAFETFDDEPFIVSEYVRGRTLREVLSQGPLPPPRAIAIASDIARALSAAHDEGVVHRDLKPENVILTDGGGVKVLDFGVAQLAQEDAPGLTREGTWLGTPAYMAPEQREGGPVDRRADIYAFGLVLAEMLTGRHPLRAPSSIDGPARSPRPSGSDPDVRIDGPLAAVVKRCLQLLPSDRYASARELLQSLDSAQAPAVGDDNVRAARWWWEFHQAATAIVYWAIVVVAWNLRQAVQADGIGSGVFFVLVLAGVVVSGNLRLNLWFTSRFFPAQLNRVRRQLHRWIRTGDWLLALTLVLAGFVTLAVEKDGNIAFLLVGLGVGVAVAAALIETVTARAAFGEETL
jgi:hypothetical protein